MRLSAGGCTYLVLQCGISREFFRLGLNTELYLSLLNGPDVGDEPGSSCCLEFISEKQREHRAYHILRHWTHDQNT